MIAQMTPDAVALASWLGSAAFVMLMLNQGASLIDRLRGKPPSGELKQSQEEITRRLAQVEADRAYGDSRRKAIYEQIEKLNKEVVKADNLVRVELQGEIGKLHEKFNGVSQGVAGLMATTAALSLQVRGMDEKMDGMPERVITTLRNTGAIGKR
jgi:hypothetical protein